GTLPARRRRRHRRAGAGEAGPELRRGGGGGPGAGGGGPRGPLRRLGLGPLRPHSPEVGVNAIPIDERTDMSASTEAVIQLEGLTKVFATDGVETPPRPYFPEGQPVAELSSSQRAVVRNREIGFIFQSFNLIGDLSVWENVELPLRYRGLGA